MSSVGSITSTSAERLQMLLLQQQQSLSRSGTSARSAQSTATDSLDGTGNQNGMAALQKAIEGAISSALSTLDKNSSADTIMSTIKNAIDQTLQANGIQPPQGGQGPHGSGGPPPGGPPPGGPPPGGPPPGAGSGDDLGSTIDRLLEENGFDPDTIRSELEKEMASASSNTSDSASSLSVLLQFWVNSGVDTQA